VYLWSTKGKATIFQAKRVETRNSTSEKSIFKFLLGNNQAPSRESQTDLVCRSKPYLLVSNDPINKKKTKKQKNYSKQKTKSYIKKVTSNV